jgi:hypothetical protein
LECLLSAVPYAKDDYHAFLDLEQEPIHLPPLVMEELPKSLPVPLCFGCFATPLRILFERTNRG